MNKFVKYSVHAKTVMVQPERDLNTFGQLRQKPNLLFNLL